MRYIKYLVRGGEGVRQTVLRPCSPRFAVVFITPYFTGPFGHHCLSSPAAGRYNPAQMLGHVLGQRIRRWRGKSTG